MRFQFTLDDYPQNIDGVIMFPSSRLLIQAGMIFMCLVALALAFTRNRRSRTILLPMARCRRYFLLDGDGRNKLLAKNDSGLQTDSSRSLYSGVKPAEGLELPSLVAGLGDPEEQFSDSKGRSKADRRRLDLSANDSRRPPPSQSQ
jgi:hypothetical protein